MGWGLSLALLVYMAWDLVWSDHGYMVYRKEHAELLALQQKMTAMQAQRKKLAAEILRLRKDPKALEEMVHRELGYVYPDEYMLIVPKQKDGTGKQSGNEDGK